MATAEQGSADPPQPIPVRSVGDQANPANDGDLGFLYTIYRFYDVDDRLLYLGRSDRIRQRIVDEEIGHPRGLPLGHDDGPKPWWREATRIELEHLPAGTTGAEAMAEERRQIEDYHPVYNREHNDGHYDRARIERAIDNAHFEVDVATAEHEAHDGVIRPMDQIVVDAERAAERLRPSGAARLHYGLRGQPAEAGPPGPPRRGRPRSDRRTSSTPFDGPGSIAVLIVFLLILATVVALALVVSLRAIS